MLMILPKCLFASINMCVKDTQCSPWSETRTRLTQLCSCLCLRPSISNPISLSTFSKASMTCNTKNHYNLECISPADSESYWLWTVFNSTKSKKKESWLLCFFFAAVHWYVNQCKCFLYSIHFIEKSFS